MQVTDLSYDSGYSTTHMKNSYDFRNTFLKEKLVPFLTSFNNVTFLKEIRYSTYGYCLRFKITGYDNMVLSVGFTSSSNANDIHIWFTKMNKAEEWEYDDWIDSAEKRTLSPVIQEDNNIIVQYQVNCFARTISDKDNNLKVLYAPGPDDILVQPCLLFVEDEIKNLEYWCINGNSDAEYSVFYASDVSYTKAGFSDGFAITNYVSEDTCIVEESIQTLNGNYKGILKEVLKISNTLFKGYGNYILIDGIKYRQLKDYTFIEDNY